MIRSIAACLALFLLAGRLNAGEKIDLRSQWQPGDVQRVVVEYEVGGDLVLKEKGKAETTPMSVVAQFRYDERLLQSTTEATLRSLRQYEQAEATIKIGDGGAKPVLPKDRERMLVELTRGRVTITCPDGLLQRETLDLVTLPGNSLVLDRLLPNKKLEIGQSWKHDAETIQALVGLDSIAVCDVSTTLVGVERNYAKLRLSGSAEGATDGVATQLGIKASYLFNTKTGHVVRMNLAIQESHEAGPIGSGVDVVAKVKLTIDAIAADAPIAATGQLSDEVVVAVPESIESLLPIDYAHDPSGFRLAHDRAWYVTSEQRERVVLRYIPSGELTAQCTLLLLPNAPKEQPMTIQQFQQETRTSLGKRFGRFISSQEWESATGMRCLCVVVEGKVDDVPILWRCYMISNEEGQRVAATVTVEQSLLERLDSADRDLVESLALQPAEPPTIAAAEAPRDETIR